MSKPTTVSPTPAKIGTGRGLAGASGIKTFAATNTNPAGSLIPNSGVTTTTTAPTIGTSDYVPSGKGGLAGSEVKDYSVAGGAKLI